MNKLVVGAFILVLFGFVQPLAQVPTPRPCPILAEDGQLHGTGLIQQDPANITSWHLVTATELRLPTMLLPTAIINSTYLPPVGNQGAQNSCMAWACGYYLRTFEEGRKRKWDVTSPQHQFSPAYLYSQVHYEPDQGSTFEDCCELMKELGCSTIATMPYDASDVSSWPSEAAFQEGMNYRIGQVNYLCTANPDGLYSIKALLNSDQIGVMAISVYGNFASISQYSYNYCLADVTGPKLGSHATTIVGYDDSRVTNDGIGAFRCVNSWGEGWGDHGYYWLSYQAATDPNARIASGCLIYFDLPPLSSVTYAAKFQISFAQFRDLKMVLGAGNPMLPTAAIPLWALGAYGDSTSRSQEIPAPQHPVWVDVSALQPNLSGTNLFFSVSNTYGSDVVGQVQDFSIVQTCNDEEVASSSVPLDISQSGAPAVANIASPVWNACDGCIPITLSPEFAPQATAGIVYSFQIIPSGGTPPYSFSWTGSLPQGLSFQTDGTIAGTPSSIGQFSFLVRSTDANGCSGTRNYTITVNGVSCSSILILPSSLPRVTVGIPIAQNFSASGGAPPYVYQYIGVLPAGMHWSTTGVLSGTPINPSETFFSVQVWDANNCTGSSSYSLIIQGTICPSMAISPEAIPVATVGVAYTQTFSASGGTPPYSYTYAGPVLTWLQLSASGVLSGTPPSPGQYTISIQAWDASNCTTSHSYTLAIYSPQCPAISLSPLVLPAATVGVAYTQTFSASGGTPPYSYTYAGPALTWLQLSASGVLSGTPPSPGQYTISIQAWDANSCTTSHSYNLTINNPPCSPISLSPGSLPAGTVGVAYTQTFTATGGTPPYIFQYAGPLPNGMHWSTSGTLSGTPTYPIQSSVTIQVWDANNCTTSQNYTLTVTNPPCPAISISPGSMPAGTVGLAYTLNFLATGGTPPYIFQYAGPLPSGMHWSTSGTLSGTPIYPIQSSVTIQVWDANNCTTSQNYTLTVTNPPCPAISISPGSMPAGTVGLAYTLNFLATGGTSPYIFQYAGLLPPGMHWSTSGMLSGTPIYPTRTAVTIQVWDAYNCATSRDYTLTIGALPCPSMVLGPSEISTAVVGTNFRQDFYALGGTPPYTYEVIGMLPAGLTFDAWGALYGAPTSPGECTFTVAASDTGGCTANRQFTLAVSAIVPPRVISARVRHKPFRVVVSGSNLQRGVQVFINGIPWPSVSWQSTSKVVLRGGSSLKDLLPVGSRSVLSLFNPDGGSVTYSFLW